MNPSNQSSLPSRNDVLDELLDRVSDDHEMILTSTDPLTFRMVSRQSTDLPDFVEEGTSQRDSIEQEVPDLVGREMDTDATMNSGPESGSTGSGNEQISNTSE